VSESNSRVTIISDSLKMDALVGYGSDSDNSDQAVVPSPVAVAVAVAVGTSAAAGGLSGLLGHYSGDDDSDEDMYGIKSNQTCIEGVKKGVQSIANGVEAIDEKAHEHAAFDGQSTKKRRKRWDAPHEDGMVHNVIPPPTLLNDTSNQDPYQSLALFHKDHTTSLRHKLSQQYQTQSQHHESEGGGVATASVGNPQLANTLEHLYDQFQRKNPNSECTTSPTSSFAAHLKSKHEFGNPHLLKTIIDHFHIQPLESHIGNKFKSFEYVDRLMSAEERARVAALNYDSSRGGGDIEGMHGL
jgi:hypothetical protein